MKRLKVVDFGTEVQGVRLEGDRRNPEPESFRVSFPGGDVDVVRTENGEYWVHVRVDTLATHGHDESAVISKIVDGRLDIEGRHTSEVDRGEIDNPDLYHLAVRIARREVRARGGA